MTNPTKQKTLNELLEDAANWWRSASQKEKDEMIRKQRESWVRGELGWPKSKYKCRALHGRVDRNSATDETLAALERVAGGYSSLKTIVSKCADSLGNGAAISHDCSIAFMRELPIEIGLHVASLTEDRDAWKERSEAAEAERDKYKSMVMSHDLLMQSADLLAERDALREKLRKAIEIAKDAIIEWGDNAEYKGDYLIKKHGDKEGIAELRATLAEIEAE